jgi:hypothetical protein
VRGRPKRNSVRRSEPKPCGRDRRTELSLRCGADCPWDLVGITVWRIKRRPVWNMLAAEDAALSVVAESQVETQVLRARCWRPERSPEITCGPRRGPIGLHRL